MTASNSSRGVAATLSRRQFLHASALISSGLLLGVACGPTSAPAPSSASTAPAAAPAKPATTTAASAGTPTRGGNLRVAIGVDIATLDPHLSGSKIDRQVYHNLYEPLLMLDDKLGIQPNLA